MGKHYPDPPHGGEGERGGTLRPLGALFLVLGVGGRAGGGLGLRRGLSLRLGLGLRPVFWGGWGCALVWGLFHQCALGIIDAAVTNDEQLTVAEELIRPRSPLKGEWVDVGVLLRVFLYQEIVDDG